MTYHLFNNRIIPLCILILIHFNRAYDLLVNSQFWGEDGFIFFEHAYNNGVTSIAVPYAGYYHTLIRIFAFITTFFPIELSPYIFNYSTFLLHLTPVFLLYSSRTDKYLDEKEKFVFSLIYILCPGTYETFITLTNIQWYIPLWVIIYLLSDKPSSRWINILETIFLAIATITGPFILFILPLYIAAVVLKKTKLSTIDLFILLGGFFIQVYTIANNFNAGNSATKDLSILPFLISVKVFWNSLFGIEGQLSLLKEMIFHNIYFLSSGFILWLIISFIIIRTNNLLLIFLTLFSGLITLAGFYKMLGEISPEPKYSVRYAINSIFILIYSYYYLYRYYGRKAYKYAFLGLFIVSLFIAIPFDYKNTRMYDLGWEREIHNFFLANRYESVVIPINNPGGKGLSLIKKGDELPGWHSKIQNLELPPETNNLMYAFDVQQNQDIFMIINGWAFATDINSKKSRIFVVLKSASESYIYNTRSQVRGDVGEYFKSYLYNYSGFNCSASKKGLKPGIYYVGLLMHTDGQHFLHHTDKRVTVHTPIATVSDLTKFVDSQSVKLKYNIDALEQTDNQLYIRGWAFLQGIESNKTAVRLILKTEDECIPLNINQEARADVTAYFVNEPNSKNYDTSGFSLRTKLQLPPKKYKILIAVLQENGIETLADTYKEIEIK